MGITKKLNNWETAGLISSKQKEAVLEYEKQHNQPTFLYSMLFLGIFCIGLGIISVISSNWEAIPATVKLLADFVLLVLSAWGIYLSYKAEKSLWTEVLLFFYALLILGSIGLTGQIFNLPSALYKALLFWSVLVFPLLLVSRRILLPVIWIPVFFTAFFLFCWEIPQIRYYADYLTNAFPALLEIIIMFALILIYSLMKYFVPKHFENIIRAMGVWVGIILAGEVILLDIASFGIFHSKIFISSSFFASISLKLMVWGGISLAVAALYVVSSYYKVCGLSVRALAIIFLYTLIAQLLPESETAFEIWGALLSLTILSLLGRYACKINSGRMFNLVTALIAFRIFIIYLQVFGSLLTTGVGLIISGTVLLLIMLGWIKFRYRLMGGKNEK